MVNLQNLNVDTRWEMHHTPSPFNLVSTVSPEKKKTVVEAWNGYHSIPLSEEAHDFTFITEWGRYRYLQAPQGFQAFNDGYTKWFNDITGFPCVARCVDDSILRDDDVISFWHTGRYIKLCADNGIIFNPEKFHFAKDNMEFAGFAISSTGYRTTQKLLESIREFPFPTIITGVNLSLVWSTKFHMHLPIMSSFRELLKHKSRFYWAKTLEQLFQQSKADPLSCNNVHKPMSNRGSEISIWGTWNPRMCDKQQWTTIGQFSIQAISQRLGFYICHLLTKICPIKQFRWKNGGNNKKIQ